MKTLLLLISLLQSAAALAALPNNALLLQAGPGGTGGGNPQEAEFLEMAKNIQTQLNKNPGFAKSSLGIDTALFDIALATTQVQCSYEPYSSTMQAQNKLLFFNAETNSIYIDCPHFDSLKNSDATVRNMLIFHEYMRKAVAESSSYEVSLRLSGTLDSILNQNTTILRTGVYQSRRHIGVCLGGNQCRKWMVQESSAQSISINGAKFLSNGEFYLHGPTGSTVQVVAVDSFIACDPSSGNCVQFWHNDIVN